VSPRPLEEPEMLGADTAMAFVSDYDIAYLVGWFDGTMGKVTFSDGTVREGGKAGQGLEMMKAGMQASGVDFGRLLKSYGKRLGFLLTLDPEKRVTLPLGKAPLSIPEPAFALMVRVNDNYLFDTLKAKLTASGQNKASEVDGVKKIVFPRLPAPFPLEPVIAQKGEWLLAASRLSLVDDIFGNKAPRLAESDVFKEMAYRLPRRGNGFGYVSPLLPRLIAQMLRENKATFPVPAAMERIAAFLQGAKGFCGVIENSDQGLVYTVNHGFEISSLPGLIEAFMEIAREKAKGLAAAVPAPPPVGQKVK
jgi:hypothetical protein